MKLYFDSAYVAKFYLREPDSAVRALADQAEPLHSSEWCLAEVACTLHRQVREGALTGREAAEIRKVFRDDVATGIWVLAPVTRDFWRSWTRWRIPCRPMCSSAPATRCTWCRRGRRGSPRFGATTVTCCTRRGIVG